MPACLMLDVDGVLVDGRPEDGRRWDHDLRADLGIAPEALAEAFFARDWREVIIGRRALRPALAESLRRIPTEVSADALIDYWFRKDARIVGSVLADCRAARAAGVPVYLATNQEHERARYLMETLSLGAEVDGIAHSAAAGAQKPDAQFYAYAEGVAGHGPDALLLVDDTPANVEGARTAGWHAVHWTRREPLSAILERAFGL